MFNFNSFILGPKHTPKNTYFVHYWSLSKQRQFCVVFKRFPKHTTTKRLLTYIHLSLLHLFSFWFWFFFLSLLGRFTHTLACKNALSFKVFTVLLYSTLQILQDLLVCYTQFCRISSASFHFYKSQLHSSQLHLVLCIIL